jgi:hypothetical protein
MRPEGRGTTPRTTGIRIRALAPIAAAVLLTFAVSVGVASADVGRDHRDAQNTFTKWVTTEPPVAPVLKNMAGIVGGDVGDGTFAGEVLTLAITPATSTTPAIKVIDAAYHFTGSRHSFTAAVHVVQTGLTNGSTAVITGQVTEGWLEDDLVEGEYTQVTCEQAPGVFGTCFQGTLDILRGSKSGD